MLDDPGIEKPGLYFRYYIHAAATAAGRGTGSSICWIRGAA